MCRFVLHRVGLTKGIDPNEYFVNVGGPTDPMLRRSGQLQAPPEGRRRISKTAPTEADQQRFTERQINVTASQQSQPRTRTITLPLLRGYAVIMVCVLWEQRKRFMWKQK